MDETDKLAYSVMEAFEAIPELEPEWLTVPRDPGREDAVVELEVCATEAFLAGTHLGPDLGVRGEVRLPVGLIRGRSGEELLGLLREELVESEEFRRVLVAGGVLGEAARRRRGVSRPEQAEKNRGRRPASGGETTPRTAAFPRKIIRRSRPGNRKPLGDADFPTRYV